MTENDAKVNNIAPNGGISPFYLFDPAMMALPICNCVGLFFMTKVSMPLRAPG